MGRKEEREKVMHFIFQMDIQSDYSEDFANKCLEELDIDSKEKSYVENILFKFLDNKETIDQVIEKNSNEWKINRIAKVDLAILRVAITEIYYVEDIPESVSINEAVELGKTFSTEESGSFINGILGNVLKGK